jgi:hypothetical protein
VTSGSEATEVRIGLKPIRVLPPPPPNTTSRIGVAAALLVVFGFFAACAGLGQVSQLSWPDWFKEPDKPPPRAFPVLEPSRPIRIAIPSINVQAPVQGVGRADDGSIAVPTLRRHNQAGWYENGPAPGQFGPAIIVGHADTRDGPSIFYGLTKLRPGARVEVTRRDREVAVFEVNSVERFAKSKLPVDRVYGAFERPSLRLITCGGRWAGGGIGSSDNVVVFASLVSTHRA